MKSNLRYFVCASKIYFAIDSLSLVGGSFLGTNIGMGRHIIFLFSLQFLENCKASRTLEKFYGHFRDFYFCSWGDPVNL